MRTSVGGAISDRARAVFPAGTINDFATPPGVDLIVDRASGVDLWASNGRHYVDHLLGSGPLVLGHGHPYVRSKIIEQLERGSTYYLPSVPAIALAEMICRLVPSAELVRYCSDGSEAVFYAMRIARAVTHRDLILKFEGGFHGHTDYSLQSFHPGSPAHYPDPEPDSAGIPLNVGETVLVASYNDLEQVGELMAKYGDRVAAIVVEPVQRNIQPAPGFLAGLRSLCDASGSLLIFDEVVTGFRLHMGGAQALYGVTPDLSALGKVLGGGLAIGCVAGREAYMELAGTSVKPTGVYMSGTLNGNPLSCAAGMATLEVMEEISGCDIITARGTQLKLGLSAALVRKGIKGVVIGPEAFPEVVFGVTNVQNYREYISSNRAVSMSMGVRLLGKGILMRPGTKLYVSAVHSADQIAATIAAVEASLEEMIAEGEFR